MTEIEVVSKKRDQFIDITARIKEVIRREEFISGICFVFCPHTTAGITINENADPDVQTDITDYLEKLVPQNKGYRHGEGNSDAHIKASLIGSGVNMIVERGEMVLGTWQGVYFCEFDGPRRRKVYLKLLKGLPPAR